MSQAEKLLDEILMASEQATPLKSARKCMLEVLERGMAEAAAAVDSDRQMQAKTAETRADTGFGGGGLVAIKTLLSRDPCVHASRAIQMIDAILAEQPAPSCPECVFGVCHCGQKAHPETDATRANNGVERGQKQPAREPDYWLGFGLQAHTEKPFDGATPVWTTPHPHQHSASR